MSIDQMLIVAGITWLAVISPGADFAVVSRNSSIYGRPSGLASSAGIASGCWLHISYAIFGIGLIMQFVPNLFSIIQISGACYLIYVGITTIFSKSAQPSATDAPVTIPYWKHYAGGLLTNSLNPKTSIFVISLYTQIIGPQTSLLEQILWGAFISLSHLLWFALIAFFMSTTKIRHWIISHQRIFNRLIGAVLVSLGIALFMTDNLAL